MFMSVCAARGFCGSKHSNTVIKVRLYSLKWSNYNTHNNKYGLIQQQRTLLAPQTGATILQCFSMLYCICGIENIIGATDASILEGTDSNSPFLRNSLLVKDQLKVITKPLSNVFPECSSLASGLLHLVYELRRSPREARQMLWHELYEEESLRLWRQDLMFKGENQSQPRVNSIQLYRKKKHVFS